MAFSRISSVIILLRFISRKSECNKLSALQFANRFLARSTSLESKIHCYSHRTEPSVTGHAYLDPALKHPGLAIQGMTETS